LDRLIHERVRLGMLSALAVTDVMNFTELKQVLDTTDGNLSVHARKLEEAEYVSCTKSFQDRVPHTDYRITRKRRRGCGAFFTGGYFMIQSTTHNSEPRHVATIMDGNGRWATKRALPRPAGHRAGVSAARRVIEAAAELGIGTLTLYAFSSDNWYRPVAEVASLMRLIARYPREETTRCIETGVCVSVIGRRDRLPDTVRGAVESCESATARGRAARGGGIDVPRSRATLRPRRRGRGPLTRSNG
jgi:DNA-binding transcriptional ArsR family regulator